MSIFACRLCSGIKHYTPREALLICAHCDGTPVCCTNLGLTPQGEPVWVRITAPAPIRRLGDPKWLSVETRAEDYFPQEKIATWTSISFDSEDIDPGESSDQT